MRAFIDTSAFIAFLIAEDENHQEAARVWKELVASDEQLITSNYVLAETCSLLQRRSTPSTVRSFVEDVVPVVLAQWVDTQLHSEGVSGMLMSGKRGPGLVDCVSFALMRKLKLRRVFTFDRHFGEQGFEIAR